MKRLRGFTLIELMTVVAIIAILAAISISIYQNSVAKAQLSEAFSTVDALKTDVADYRRQTGICPTAGVGGILDPGSYAGQYVAKATVNGGSGACVITAQMRDNTIAPRLRGSKVVFTMSSSTQTTQWICKSDAPAIYLPQACR